MRSWYSPHADRLAVTGGDVHPFEGRSSRGPPPAFPCAVLSAAFPSCAFSTGTAVSNLSGSPFSRLLPPRPPSSASAVPRRWASHFHCFFIAFQFEDGRYLTGQFGDAAACQHPPVGSQQRGRNTVRPVSASSPCGSVSCRGCGFATSAVHVGDHLPVLLVQPARFPLIDLVPEKVKPSRRLVSLPASSVCSTSRSCVLSSTACPHSPGRRCLVHLCDRAQGCPPSSPLPGRSKKSRS